MPIIDGNVELTFTIHARPETVFRFFTDPARFARWWATPGGGEATIDAREGGQVRIVYQNGHVMQGEVVEIDEPRRFVMSWGYEEEEKGIPPGASRVEIRLEPIDAGTRLTLRHSDLPAGEMREGHETGWRHYLSTMAAECANDEFGDRLTDIIDAWFEAWATADDAARLKALRACCTEDVRMRSPWACSDGVQDVNALIGNAIRHMPGITTARSGEPALSHDHATCTWAATTPDGNAVMRGDNVFRLNVDGRIELVIGFVGQ